MKTALEEFFSYLRGNDNPKRIIGKGYGLKLTELLKI